MAVRIEGNEIIIDGWEKGMSDDPYSGLNYMRGVNTVSVPGEASVAFSQTNIAPPIITGTISSIDTSTDTITGTANNIAQYTAVQFTTTGTLPDGISLSTTYWIKYVSANSFQIYGLGAYTGTANDCYLSGARVDIRGAGTGTHTFTSINIGRVTYFERTYGYCVDANGRVWTPLGSSAITNFGVGYAYMNNTVTGNCHGNGISIYRGSDGNKWLFVFEDGQIDYTQVNDVLDVLGLYAGTGSTPSGITPSWTYNWKTLNTPAGTSNPHEAVVDVNNVMYFTDATFVGSLREKPGQTFAPGTPSTYEWNVTALATPKNDIVQCIEQLGDRLLIGGLFNFVYSWNKISTGFDTMQIVEKGSTRIITVNTNAFIFAGKRGRIFKTNGSQAQLYKKVPDFLLGIDPIYTFYGVAYNKNQLYFGVSATTNALAASTVYSGVWAIDSDTDGMRVPGVLSTSTATCCSIFTLPSSTSGFSIYTAWTTGTTYGIDISNSTPITSYADTAASAIVESERIPIGQFLNKTTPINVEFKLSAPLVSGEGVKIWYKNNLGSYTTLGETTTVGAISDFYISTFDRSEWIQFKIELKSTASSPSFTRFRELRIRKA